MRICRASTAKTPISSAATALASIIEISDVRLAISGDKGHTVPGPEALSRIVSSAILRGSRNLAVPAYVHKEFTASVCPSSCCCSRVAIVAEPKAAAKVSDEQIGSSEKWAQSASSEGQDTPDQLPITNQLINDSAEDTGSVNYSDSQSFDINPSTEVNTASASNKSITDWWPTVELAGYAGATDVEAAEPIASAPRTETESASMSESISYSLSASADFSASADESTYRSFTVSAPASSLASILESSTLSEDISSQDRHSAPASASASNSNSAAASSSASASASASTSEEPCIKQYLPANLSEPTKATVTSTITRVGGDAQIVPDSNGLGFKFQHTTQTQVTEKVYEGSVVA